MTLNICMCIMYVNVHCTPQKITILTTHASFPVTLSLLPPPALLGINNTYMYATYAAACQCDLQSSVHVVTGSGALLSLTLTY